MLETAGEDREYEILYKKMIKLLVEFWKGVTVVLLILWNMKFMKYI
jgi:hypothetical protein